MALTIFKKLIQKFNTPDKNLKNRQSIFIFISSYTSAPVLSMLAAGLIDEKEKVLFVIQKKDDYLINKIKFFVPGFTNQYLVIDEETQKIFHHCVIPKFPSKRFPKNIVNLIFHWIPLRLYMKVN